MKEVHWMQDQKTGKLYKMDVLQHEYLIEILDFQECVNRKEKVQAGSALEAIRKARASSSMFEVVTDCIDLGPSVYEEHDDFEDAEEFGIYYDYCM